MSRFLDDFRVMLGGAPKKPTAVAPEVARVMELKYRDKGAHVQEKLRLQEEGHPPGHKWRNRRWAVLVAVNLLFVVSFWLDIQILEGALTGSRFVGFHMIDLNAALQVMLAHKHIIINLVIGTLTVFVLWALLGGRSFCSWVCPYHLVAELTEKLHLWLAKKKLVSDHAFHRGARTVFWALFALLAFVTGYTVFETISPTGILSRALIYGPGLALGWVALLLVFEVLWSRRVWCRYVCPIGLTYGVVGSISPLHVRFDVESCLHEGDCRKVCLVPHVLDVTVRGRAATMHTALGPDCTRCGLCVDVCRSGALTFEMKGMGRFQERRKGDRHNPKPGTRVLVVDASAEVAAQLRDYLESAHCAVSVVAPDAEAVEKAIDEQQPGLIFLDVAGEGLEALRNLRDDAIARNIPVVALDGGNGEGDAARHEGADDVLAKPFTRAGVFARVARLLDGDGVPRRLESARN
ncbi:MAG: NapH/MauN family ferredoxin-type protein [Azoarcus sp.]|nr:NapH/MauN family ferredoxin-type protein [Azoarcus sp.]